MKKFLSFITALSLAMSISFGEEKKSSDPKPFPLVISFFSHKASFPFQGMINSPIHPGISVGTEIAYKKGKNGKLFQTINAGYFNNKFNAKAIFLLSEFGYRQSLKMGVFGDVFLGLGYIHSFHPRPIYSLNSHGVYEKLKDKGKPAALISAAMGLGYDFNRITNWPLSIFLKYQYALQGPHNLDSPLWPNSMLHVGFRILF
jgi:hypothetical protein